MDTDRHVKAIQHLAHLLLDDAAQASTLRPEVIELAQTLASLSGFRPDPNAAAGETRTPAGLAISPTLAARCADDYVRTIVFLRGVHASIQRHAPADRPARILYAGCGPLAPLAIPLMSVLTPDDARFTLIDIHPDSIASTSAIIDALGFQDFVEAIHTTDIAAFTPDEPADIVVLETMKASLEDEPQVTLARHLARACPDAVLIPESVRVNYVLLDPDREFASIDPETGHAPEPDRDRLELGTVFELSRKTINRWQDISEDILPADTVALPLPLPGQYTHHLITRITVFGEHELTDYESGLTYPAPAPLPDRLRAGEAIAFEYLLGPAPGLRAYPTRPPSSPPGGGAATGGEGGPAK